MSTITITLDLDTGLVVQEAVGTGGVYSATAYQVRNSAGLARMLEIADGDRAELFAARTLDSVLRQGFGDAVADAVWATRAAEFTADADGSYR